MKWLDLVLTVVSVITLVSSILVMVVLVEVGEAVAAAESSAAGIGLDPALISGFLQQAMFVLQLLWVYTLLVFLTSLYAIWNGWKNLKKK